MVDVTEHAHSRGFICPTFIMFHAMKEYVMSHGIALLLRASFDNNGIKAQRNEPLIIRLSPTDNSTMISLLLWGLVGNNRRKKNVSFII